jgi:hypothetical protein
MATASHPRTLLPGEVSHLEMQEHAKSQQLPEWVTVADHVLDRLPAISSKLRLAGPGGHIVALWIVVGAVTVALVSHLVGDGTVRSTAKRSECLVEWLVERAVAEDRGEPPPPFSPLGCRQ